MVQHRILLVDLFRGEVGRHLEGILSKSGQFRLCKYGAPAADPVSVGRVEALRQCMGRFRPHEVVVALGCISLERDSRFLQAIRPEPPSAALLVAADSCKPADMLALLSCGASDFFVAPLTAPDVLTRIERFLPSERSGLAPLPCSEPKRAFRGMVGASPAFREMVETISTVSGCDATVLVSGETGTGKELCARAIHYASPRAGKPFVSVNCGAIPAELVENELFGHLRSAYTGASTSAGGLIQEAEKGTLFLDEIDCLAPKAQVKLLRFLQEKEFRPLGAARLRTADVRVVAATNINPQQAVAEGQLRQDLYYRLNIVHLAMPPLRERREDIPLLARHFLDKYSSEFDKPPLQFTHDAALALLSHDWPGNVRELEHVVERAVILCRSGALCASDLKLPRQVAFRAKDSFREAKAKVVDQFERNYIEGLLLTHRGNITTAAKAARKHRRAFWELMRKHQIDAESFKQV